MVTVSYKGFLQTVLRIFATRAAAEQWARQVGVFSRVVIQEVTKCT